MWIYWNKWLEEIRSFVFNAVHGYLVLSALVDSIVVCLENHMTLFVKSDNIVVVIKCFCIGLIYSIPFSDGFWVFDFFIGVVYFNSDYKHQLYTPSSIADFWVFFHIVFGEKTSKYDLVVVLIGSAKLKRESQAKNIHFSLYFCSYSRTFILADIF